MKKLVVMTGVLVLFMLMIKVMGVETLEELPENRDFKNGEEMFI